MIAAMFSCRQNEARRERTLASWDKVMPWLPVEVYLDECDPPSADATGVIAAHILRNAARRAEGVLLLEDDLEFHPSFPYFLGLADNADDGFAVTYFYLHESDHDLSAWYGAHMADQVRAGRIPDARLYYVQTVKDLYGSQCVFIPSKWLREMIEFIEAKGKSLDWCLWNACNVHGIRVCVALPNPVQHTQARREGWPDPRPHLKRRSVSYEQWGRMGVAQDQGAPSESPDETPPA